MANLNHSEERKIEQHKEQTQSTASHSSDGCQRDKLRSEPSTKRNVDYQKTCEQLDKLSQIARRSRR